MPSAMTLSCPAESWADLGHWRRGTLWDLGRRPHGTLVGWPVWAAATVTYAGCYFRPGAAWPIFSSDATACLRPATGRPLVVAALPPAPSHPTHARRTG